MAGEAKSHEGLILGVVAITGALIVAWLTGLLGKFGIAAPSSNTTASVSTASSDILSGVTTDTVIPATQAQATANLVSGSAAATGNAAGGYAFPAGVYEPTSSDVASVSSQFSDSTNSYVVTDLVSGSAANNYSGTIQYTLAAAMAKCLKLLLVICYTGDGYCAAQTGNVYQYVEEGLATLTSSGTGLDTMDSLASGIIPVLEGAPALGDNGVGEEGQAAVASDISSNLVQSVPVAGPIISKITSIVGSFLGAQHAQAVTTENGILCPLISLLNAWYATILGNVQKGNWSAADAAQLAVQVQTQAHAAIALDTSSGALHAVGEEVDAITAMWQLIAEKSS